MADLVSKKGQPCFSNGSLRLKCLYRIQWEADAGADHARMLTWEPTPEQRRSIAVRLPESASASSAAKGKGEPTSKGQQGRGKGQPRGSVGAELGGCP